MMEARLETPLAVSKLSPARSREWMHRVMKLLEATVDQLHDPKHIDCHISGAVLVADLCALVQRSEAHFSRSFKRTFGVSLHSFVIRCHVELAARYMLTTDASLSDIALRCGFVELAHLCKLLYERCGAFAYLSLQIMHRATQIGWRRAVTLMLADGLRRTVAPPAKLH